MLTKHKKEALVTKKLQLTFSGDALNSIEKIKLLLKDAETETDVVCFAVLLLEMCLFKKVRLLDKNGNFKTLEYFWNEEGENDAKR